MRVLLLNQFYPPDPAPTGHYLHDLGKALSERGHQVRVICSRRSYNGAATYPARENRDGVEITRLAATGFGRRGFAGKLADYATFYGSLWAALMSAKGKADLVISLTTPPYIGLLGKWAAQRHGCRHVNWVMDLYPDVMRAQGMAKKSGFIFRVLQKLTRSQLKGSKFDLALGPAMAERIEGYQWQKSRRSSVNCQPKTFWTPLWSKSNLVPWPDLEPNPLRAERGWKEDEVVFLYSGNMGLGHRFGEFLEAAKRLGSKGPRWVFAGGGKRRAEVEAFGKANPELHLEFLDYVPDPQLQAHLCAADVHLASLDSAWQGLMVPSKLQGSFAVGRAVLYVGGTNCEIASWIIESGGGWVVPENNIDALLAAIKQASDPAQFQARGRAALRFAHAHFQKSINCAQIAEWVESN